MKYTKTTLEKLQKVFDEMDYVVRYERGNFQSGYCIVEDRKIAIINKFFDVESRINTLIEILTSVEVDQTVFSDKTLDFYKKVSKSFTPITTSDNEEENVAENVESPTEEETIEVDSADPVVNDEVS